MLYINTDATYTNLYVDEDEDDMDEIYHKIVYRKKWKFRFHTCTLAMQCM